MKTKRKQTIALAGALSLLLLMAGCGGEAPAETTQPTPTSTVESEDTAQVVSPMKSVENGDAFLRELGIGLNAPLDAEDATYDIIDDHLCQILFTMDGVDYTLRAAKEDGDISGVYEEFADGAKALCIDGESVSIEVTVQTVLSSGNKLATWNFQDTYYSLYASSDVEESVVTDLAWTISQRSFLRD